MGVLCVPLDLPACGKEIWGAEEAGGAQGRGGGGLH